MNARFKEIAWFAILAGYTGYFFYLIAFDKLQDLMHPRMTPFVVVGLVGLAVFTFFQGRRMIRRPQEGRKGMLLFVVPFAILPLTLGANSSVLSANGSISLGGGPAPIDLTTKLQASVNPFLPTPKEKPAGVKNGIIPAAGPIVLDEKNYYVVYNELYAHPDAYAGRTVRVTGFVYRDSTEPAGQFIAAREMMWCCAADAVEIGFIADAKSAPSLARDEWVSVEGLLSTTSYVNQYTRLRSTVPLIEVSRVARLGHPDFAFVYPK